MIDILSIELEKKIYYFDLQLFAAEDEGRTEEPTEYKKRKAREEGNVPKSQELTAIIVFLANFWALALIGEFVFRSLWNIMRYYIENINSLVITRDNIVPIFIDMLWISASSTVPFLIIGVVFAIFGNVVQGGFVFSTKRISFNFGKIFGNIPSNFAKMFWSREAVFNLAKSLVKVLVVFFIAFVVINAEIGKMMAFSRMSAATGFLLFWRIIFNFVSFSGIALLLIAIMDYAFQRWVYIESLKMTKQEIKEEFKEMEGNPEIKAKIREMERRLLSRKMYQEVPKADVVITNPTHIAVALKYEPAYMNAPVVVAKGEGPVAQKIKEIAKENKVYIIENKPLARELYKKVDIGQEIPQEFFVAVAKILSIVYEMKGSVAA
ncbi:MAG: flagellar biosynthesis protein FlhB [Brevinematales bacterium]|nr:flagellar biosynthesis protein FlhB [Brevinematales bacterium]